MVGWGDEIVPEVVWLVDGVEAVDVDDVAVTASLVVVCSVVVIGDVTVDNGVDCVVVIVVVVVVVVDFDDATDAADVDVVVAIDDVTAVMVVIASVAVVDCGGTVAAAGVGDDDVIVGDVDDVAFVARAVVANVGTKVKFDDEGVEVKDVFEVVEPTA